MPRRIFWSSGELSSELHSEMVLRAFAVRHPGQFEFFGLGGKVAESAGLRLVENIVDRAVIGFAEAVKNLGYFRNLLRRIDAMMERKEMDAVMLVDYPGLNMHIARLAAKHRLPTVFYISPQVWAWRRGRAKTLAKRIKKMLVIFPFEASIYEEAGCPVEFVGHPFVDRAKPAQDRAAARRTIGASDKDALIALMPGSRKQEAVRHFPVMWEAVKRLSARRAVVAAVAVAPSIPASLYRYWMRDTAPNLRSFLIESESARHSVVSAADLALVTTGTTTVETMLLGTPMIAGYRLSALSYWIARMLANVKHCAMPNILANDEIVPELIQRDFTSDRMARVAEELLNNPARANRMRERLRETAALLGPPGAADRVADAAAKVFLS